MNRQRPRARGDHWLHGNGVATQTGFLAEGLEQAGSKSGCIAPNSRKRRVIFTERSEEVVSGVVGDVGAAPIDVVGRPAFGLISGHRVGLIHAVEVGCDRIGGVPRG